MGARVRPEEMDRYLEEDLRKRRQEEAGVMPDFKSTPERTPKPQFNTSAAQAIDIMDRTMKPQFSSTDASQAPEIPLKQGQVVAFGSRMPDPANPLTSQVVTPIMTNNPTLGREFQNNNFDVHSPATQQPTIKPTFGNAGLDLDGDGIPDGATVERVVQRQGPNGEQIKDKLVWNKVIAGMAANRPREVKPEFGLDPTAQARSRMAIDKPMEGALNPFTGKPTTAQQAIEIQMQQLKRQASGKYGGSVAEKIADRKELANLEQQKLLRENREHTMGILERKLEAPLHLQAMKGKQAAEGLDKRILADLDFADRKGGWAVKERQVHNEGQMAMEQERSRSKAETTQLLKEGRYTEALVKGIFSKTVAEINADAKKVSAQLTEQGKERLAKILHENRFKIDGLMMAQLTPRMTEQQQIELVNQILRSSGMITTPDASSSTVTTPEVQPPPEVTPRIVPAPQPPTPIPVSQQKQPVAQQNQLSAEPIPGMIRENYRFKGGDPRQKNNWELIRND